MTDGGAHKANALFKLTKKDDSQASRPHFRERDCIGRILDLVGMFMALMWLMVAWFKIGYRESPGFMRPMLTLRYEAPNVGHEVVQRRCTSR